MYKVVYRIYRWIHIIRSCVKIYLMLSPINLLARTNSLTQTFTPTFSLFHPPIAYHKIPSNARWFIANHTDLLRIRPLRNWGTVLIYFPCQLTRPLIQYDRLPGTREGFYGGMRVQRSQITSIQPRGIIFPISSAYNLVCSALLLRCDLYAEHCATYAEVEPYIVIAPPF